MIKVMTNIDKQYKMKDIKCYYPALGAVENVETGAADYDYLLSVSRMPPMLRKLLTLSDANLVIDKGTHRQA